MLSAIWAAVLMLSKEQWVMYIKSWTNWVWMVHYWAFIFHCCVKNRNNRTEIIVLTNLQKVEILKTENRGASWIQHRKVFNEERKSWCFKYTYHAVAFINIVIKMSENFSLCSEVFFSAIDSRYTYIHKLTKNFLFAIIWKIFFMHLLDSCFYNPLLSPAFHRALPRKWRAELSSTGSDP